MPSGRFAPSPSGRLHLGNLRTALVAWLFARYDDSPFFLRFDDLGSAVGEHYQSQPADLRALGLDFDGETIYQRDRKAMYQSVIDQLEADDLLYPCFCSRREIREAAEAPNAEHAGHRYPGTCRNLSTLDQQRRSDERPAALRLRTYDQPIAFVDRLAGAHRYQVDDFVIRRNDGTPAYHLATVVDDHEQQVELVVRGSDLLESTSRHLLLYELLGWDAPDHAHVPLVLAPNRDRLAKRHGAVNLGDQAAVGRSAADVRSYLARTLNLARPDETVDLKELVGRFDPSVLPVDHLVVPAEVIAGQAS